jgi:hypothetical protein
MGWDQSEPTAMIAEIQKVVVLSIAFVFVCAAQAAAGLNWRGVLGNRDRFPLKGA